MTDVRVRPAIDDPLVRRNRHVGPAQLFSESTRNIARNDVTMSSSPRSETAAGTGVKPNRRASAEKTIAAKNATMMALTISRCDGSFSCHGPAASRRSNSAVSLCARYTVEPAVSPVKTARNSQPCQ